MNLFYKLASIATIVALFSGCGDDNDDKKVDTKTLSIFHVNDVHSHVAEKKGMTLMFGEIKAKVPVGGMPRVIQKIKILKQSKPNSLMLNAGDTFQGTSYYTLFKGKADTDMINFLKWDAIALGNHEFDDGDDFLAKYLGMIDSNIPILAANVVPDKGNVLEDKWKPYVIKELYGEKVGIIGIDIVGKTKASSSPSEQIKFYDEVQTAQKYINELTQKGVKRVILLSHVGFDNDVKYASQLSGVDVIVGGDSHTLVGDFTNVGLKNPNNAKKYPTLTTSKDGKKVCIVQAWNYAYIVGNLDVTFDEKGDVQKCSGNPILLLGDSFITGEKRDENKKKIPIYASKEEVSKIKKIIQMYPNIEQVQKDKEALAKLDVYTKKIEKQMQVVIGESNEVLGHNRIPEDTYDKVNTLPLGSDIVPIVAKSFYFLSKRADICIQNGGGVRVAINKGNITMDDAYTLLPFANTLYELNMTGAQIKQTLEDALNMIYEDGTEQKTGGGSFPYAYGLKYDIDITKPKNSRVSNVEVMDRKTKVWSNIDMEKTYVVVTNDYIASGKDGYVTMGKVFKSGVDTYLDYAMSFVRYMEHLKSEGKKLTKLPADEHPIKSFKK